MKTIFVLHDCWNFTGHCAHFSIAKCERWKYCCYNCPNLHNYPTSLFFDSSKKNYLEKQKLFLNLPKTVFVCPSMWMASMASQSFLKSNEIVVINNGIDTSIFNKDFNKEISNKKTILCVASIFTKSKGIDDIVALSKLLGPNERILIVGRLSRPIKIPSNICHINQVADIYEMKKIYSSADVFFNPTYEDTFPSVNMEALSCGVPVICYKTCGACEMIDTSFAIEQGDYKKAYELIRQILYNQKEYSFKGIENFSKNNMHNKYLELIKKVLNN